MLEQQIESLKTAIVQLTTTAVELTRALETSQVSAPKPTTEQPAKQAPAVSEDDVRTALLRLAKKHGRDAALAVLAAHGDAKKIGDLNATDYASVVTAAAEYGAAS